LSKNFNFFTCPFDEVHEELNDFGLIQFENEQFFNPVALVDSDVFDVTPVLSPVPSSLPTSLNVIDTHLDTILAEFDSGFTSEHDIVTVVCPTPYVTVCSAMATICNINSPSDFHIKMEDDQPILDRIFNTLNAAGNYPKPIRRIADGTRVAVKNCGSWYRGEVLSHRNGDVEIEFIDFGCADYVDVDDIGQLAKNVYEIRKIARKCTLLPPVKVQKWSEAATRKFKSMAMDGNAVFTVKIVEPGGKNVVELTHDFNQSVREELVRHQLLADEEAFIISEQVKQILWIMKTAHSTCAQVIHHRSTKYFYLHFDDIFGGLDILGECGCWCVHFLTVCVLNKVVGCRK
jgi:hypothetical protein